jgi:hypothetical protein
MLILAGKQQLTRSFMQVRQGWLLTYRGNMDDVLLSLSYPPTDV